ncbi:MAG: pseudouridine synthase [bacterium]
METPKRLNKYLSEIGYCSRREADRLIEKGAVKVNGEIPEMGIKVTTQDKIEVYNKEVRLEKDERVYLALNKPRGIVCTTDTRVEKDNIIDFINYHTRIFPIGRLDKDSEGLILLTNDGDIVNKILRSSNQHEKEYIVSVDKPISQTFIKRMSDGIYIEELGQKTKRCKVEKVSKNIFKIILTQGLNRQIRRMCSYLNYEVQSLKRTRIMNISLDIPLGQYRELSESELSELNDLLSNSEK